MNIPEIKLSEGKVQEETKSLPIKVNGQEEQIVIRKISIGARKKIMKDCTKSSVVGTQLQAEIKNEEVQVSLFKAMYVSGPFKVEEIEKLPDYVLDYVLAAYEEWAGLEKKN